MAAKGGLVAGITVGDCLELVRTSREVFPGPSRSTRHSPFFYQLLHAIGVFSADGPPTVRMLHPGYQGQAAPEQLIDRYDLACRPVRDLLVDYLRERQPGLDYTSLTTLASHLGLLFWKDLEVSITRDQLTGLGSEAAAAWKQRIRTKPVAAARGAGFPALHQRAACKRCGLSTSTSLRGRLGPGPVGPVGRPVARIRPSDIPGRKERGHSKARMDQRTRRAAPGGPGAGRRPRPGPS